jgi:hypothetical protein
MLIFQCFALRIYFASRRETYSCCRFRGSLLLQPNKRICMLTEVGSSGELEPAQNGGEAVLEL